MIENTIKLLLALLAGFAITSVSLYIARKLSQLIDARKKGDEAAKDKEDEEPENHQPEPPEPKR